MKVERCHVTLGIFSIQFNYQTFLDIILVWYAGG